MKHVARLSVPGSKKGLRKCGHIGIDSSIKPSDAVQFLLFSGADHHYTPVYTIEVSTLHTCIIYILSFLSK